MFKCAITGKFSKPNDKPIRLIVERRPREYKDTYVDDDGNKHEQIVGRGWEIAKEIDVTLAGLGVWVRNNPSDETAIELLERMTKFEAQQKLARLKAGPGTEVRA